MGAAEQIVRAVEHFNSSTHPPEVIVIVRGGGSVDDLSVFNDEPLVRAVAASSVPTLVGIGHEVDVSLVDLAADVRASTPSNAAERLTPDRRELISRLQSNASRLEERFNLRLQLLHTQLGQFAPQVIRQLNRQLASQLQAVSHKRRLLEQLSPNSALSRGYALLRQNGSLMGKNLQKKIKAGYKLQIETNFAIIKAGVEHVEKK